MKMPEILAPLTEDIDFSEAKATISRAADQATEFYNSNDIRDAGSIAVPAFVLGLVGGAVGSKVLKGTVGIGLGAVAVWWAYNELQSPSPKKMLNPPARGPQQIAPPPRKLSGCSS